MSASETLTEIIETAEKMKRELDPDLLDEEDLLILELALNKIRARLVDACWIIDGF